MPNFTPEKLIRQLRSFSAKDDFINTLTLDHLTLLLQNHENFLSALEGCKQDYKHIEQEIENLAPPIDAKSGERPALPKGDSKVKIIKLKKDLKEAKSKAVQKAVEDTISHANARKDLAAVIDEAEADSSSGDDGAAAGGAGNAQANNADSSSDTDSERSLDGDLVIDFSLDI